MHLRGLRGLGGRLPWYAASTRRDGPGGSRAPASIAAVVAPRPARTGRDRCPVPSARARLTAERNPGGRAQPTAHRRSPPVPHPPRSRAHEPRSQHHPHDLLALDSDLLAVPAHRHPHRDVPAYDPRMTTDHPYYLRVRTPADAHELVMATDRTQCAGTRTRLRTRLQRSPLITFRTRSPTPSAHRSSTSSSPGRRPAMAPVLRDRRVLRAALNRVHTEPAHRYLRARLLRATLRVALRRTPSTVQSISAMPDGLPPLSLSHTACPPSGASPGEAAKPTVAVVDLDRLGVRAPGARAGRVAPLDRQRHRPLAVVGGLDRRTRARACALMERVEFRPTTALGPSVTGCH